MSKSPSGQPDWPPAGDFSLYRTNVPYRSPEPPLAHTKPKGRWTVASGFPSRRSGYCVSYWGFEQHQFLTLAEVNPSVRSIRARPETLEWFDGSKWIEHTPDFGVYTSAGWLYCDIANPKHAESDLVAKRTRALDAGLARDGGRYRRFMPADLRVEPRLSNSKQINDCSGPDIPEADLNKVSRVMPPDGAVDIHGVASMTGMPEGEALAAVLCLAWHGVVGADMSAFLSFSTRVWRRR
ncbi:hypothetical protein RFM41_10510 [Mesorhizobium sp. VK25A]|uniref:Uncharacterized protein n=1 Tax=Mesorhizobium vachelliae TaxID=3072309 RepID=A0ABU4ZWI1_9HYPH|nr:MULTISPECIES: hypothetical protein [unclassified Mesorhizobium]MDX8529774.1 hypothetical protein [Mesorhizobium sp. VK25D]MDX8544172.1 hypothetical protein [Mesorhizobium sp. VK25A]